MPFGIYPRKPIEERFWSKVEKTSTCWNWQGFKNENNYGGIKYKGKNIKAHRWAYEQAKGKISDGLEIDHLCKNRLCVNPDHLEAVTSKENSLRSNSLAAKNARKTHCKQGHELKGKNIAPWDKGKRRTCIICKRKQQLKNYYIKKYG